MKPLSAILLFACLSTATARACDLPQAAKDNINLESNEFGATSYDYSGISYADDGTPQATYSFTDSRGHRWLGILSLNKDSCQLKHARVTPATTITTH